MSEREPDTDPLSRNSLQSLMDTPVGRRWVLKAGLTSAVALAAKTWAAPAARAASASATDDFGATELVPLQFALGSAVGVEELELLTGPHQIPLIPHTASSRRALVAAGGLWGKTDPGALTHFLEAVAMPSDRAQLVSVVGRRGDRRTVVAQLWHCPRGAVEAFAQTAARLDPRGLERVVGSDERVAELGIRAADLESPHEAAQLAGLVNDHSTAVSIVMIHPNVANLDPTMATVTGSLLHATQPVTALGNTIRKVLRSGEDVIPERPVLNPDGSQSQAVVGDLTVPMTIWGLNDTNHDFVSSTKSALVAGITAVRSDTQLGAAIDKPLATGTPLGEGERAVLKKTWIQPQGVLPNVEKYTPPVAGVAAAGRGGNEESGKGLQIKIKDPGWVNGTLTEVHGHAEQTVRGSQRGTLVALKIHNNFVRWMTAYVQYLGRDNENLSLNKGLPWPSTNHAESLGVIPQVPTVFGIPLVKSDIAEPNKIEVELFFPDNSHTARLLFCGLGFSWSGEWRQYFPESSYTNSFAPIHEVWFPALITAILGIGINAWALTGAIHASKAWAAIRSDITRFSQTFRIAVHAGLSTTDIVKQFFGARFAAMTVAEVASATAAAGGGFSVETSLSQKGAAEAALETLWRFVPELGQMIVKLLFGGGAALQFWLTIAAKLLLNGGSDALVKAIPFVGQSIAVISAAGDAASLAQCVGETLASPWVIENEVTLTYEATVTVKHDERNPTFPKTARRWQLTPTIGGSAVSDVLEGDVNTDGKAQSRPIVVKTRAPFGGDVIKWVVTFTTDNGDQVGFGSVEHNNNDLSNLPQHVEIVIGETAIPIKKETVFKRVATTAYSEEDKGYTWSNQVVVDAVREEPGVQEVISTSIATRLGVAGVVWKANNRYYVRGVPTAQDGKTIKLGTVTGDTEGYARRPFVLLDPFVEEANKGNHWLLEPHPEQESYLIRKLTLDPQTGGMTADTGNPHGVFALPVSAAAVHPGGYVVAINTNTSRVAWLEPTPFVAAGNYSGGVSHKGSEADLGLLASPIALTITHLGTVLILEDTGSLAAYDVKGNPASQFGLHQKSASLKLDEKKKYLDISVDGAGQIYLLNHTKAEDGTLNSANFGIDVLAANGQLITENKGGVNVPRLAVDYWRSVYGANYAALSVLGKPGEPKLDPVLKVPEPSLSRFDPENPRT